MTKTYLSIGDVLSLLRQEFADITISKIRFLESQGLVNPERSASGYRKFYEHDVERLRWVLRQQREHFLPLKVIRDRLDAEGGGVPRANGVAAAPSHPAPAPAHTAEAQPAPAQAAPAQEAPAPSPPPVAAQVAPAHTAPAVARASRPELVGAVLDEPHPEHAVEGNGNGASHPADVVSVLAAVAATPGRPEAVRPEPAFSAAAAPPPPHPPHALSVVGPPAAPPAPAPPPAGSSQRRAPEGAPGPSLPSSRPAPRQSAAAAAVGLPNGDPSGTDAPVAGVRPVEPAASVLRPADAGAPDLAHRASEPARPPRAPRAAPAEAAAPKGRPAAADPFSLSSGRGANLTAEELAQSSGLSVTEIASLEGFGLLRTISVGGDAYYDEDALTVAQLVAQFAAFGIEPRHLRPFRNAVDREVGLVEQLTTPLLRQRNPEARQRAIDTATDVARLGQRLQASLLRSELRRHLGT